MVRHVWWIALGGIGAAAIGGLAVAQPADAGGAAEVERLLGLVGDEIVAVRPYRPSGIETNRGYEMDTRARQNDRGDCRSQRITFFRRHYPGSGVEGGPEALDRLVVTNRYQRPGWVRSRAPRTCGDPGQGSWTAAQDDETFDRAAEALRQVAAASASDGSGFTLICTEHEKPCAKPWARLREAFDLGVGYVGYEGRTLVASHYTYLGRQWVMRIEVGRAGQPTSVTLDYPIPAFF